MKIRTKKTGANNRGKYIYYFENGEKTTLVPGKDGVTEEMIRQLHLADDREVESNLNYYTVNLPKSKNDKNEKTEKIWVSSFEQTFADQDNDKTNLMFDASVYNSVDTAYKVTSRLSIKEIAEKKLTAQHQTIVDMICRGYKSTEIAKSLCISDAAVTKAKKRIAEILKEYKMYL